MDLDAHIKEYFRVKTGDVPPYTGWLDSKRANVANVMVEAKYKKGAEIGVAQARHARQLFKIIPGLHLFCVDPWTKYSVRNSQQKQDANYQTTCNRLKDYNATILKKTSAQALADIADGSLDFVYIDGLHTFDSVMFDLIKWSAKVRKGGMIAGHDYYEFYRYGVIEAVNAYTRAHRVDAWYLTRELRATYFWVKKHND
jgi:hypothetical protein